MAKQVTTLICMLALALAAPLAAAAQGVGQDVIGEPKVPQTHSVEQADAKLAEVARARAVLDAEYAASEQVCYTRFFVNHCLDKAKEKRRLAMAGLRAVEVEASYFKRRDSVEKRDAELAERVRKDEAVAAQRALTPAAPPAVQEEAPAPQGKPGLSAGQREAEHKARMQRQAAEDAANAGQRAANVAAFERKKAESEQRQAQIAAKKAEKAAKAARQAEEAAKKAAAPPAKN